MKKFGYRNSFAGSTEVAVSCGGQIMLAIMGAGAFIMAQFLGVDYSVIAMAAIIPAYCTTSRCTSPSTQRHSQKVSNRFPTRIFRASVTGPSRRPPIPGKTGPLWGSEATGRFGPRASQRISQT